MDGRKRATSNMWSSSDSRSTATCIKWKDIGLTTDRDRRGSRAESMETRAARMKQEVRTRTGFPRHCHPSTPGPPPQAQQRTSSNMGGVAGVFLRSVR